MNQDAGRLEGFQALRGVASNFVILCHIGAIDKKYTGGFLPDRFELGGAGVDLFFVLSGFIMVAVAGRNVSPLEFVFRRMGRIYPAYWIVAITVLAFGVAAGRSVDIMSLWKALLLVPTDEGQIIAVAWTLVHEVYFYAVFAFMLVVRAAVVPALLVWSGIVALGLWLGRVGGEDLGPTFAVVTHPLTYEFILGAFIGIAYLNRSVLGGRIAHALGWFAFAGVFVLDPIEVFDYRVVLFGIPAAMVVYGIMSLEVVRGLRVHPVLISLGDWSYATYLVHYFVLAVLGRVLGAAIGESIAASLMLLLGGIVGSNFVGWMLHRCVEKPVLRWQRDVGSMRPA